MSKFILASAAALLVAASAPALASKSASAENGAASAEGGKHKGDRKICRVMENSASRMKAEKVCLTRAEWKKLDAAAE